MILSTICLVRVRAFAVFTGSCCRHWSKLDNTNTRGQVAYYSCQSTGACQESQLDDLHIPVQCKEIVEFFTGQQAASFFLFCCPRKQNLLCCLILGPNLATLPPRVNVFDGTLGAGGHAAAILQRLDSHATHRLNNFVGQLSFNVCATFCCLMSVL